MFDCIGINAFTCGFSCLNGEFDALELVSSDCSSKDGFCAVSACCPQCASVTSAYKECLLDSNCDTICQDVVPIAPSPDNDDFASPQCVNEGAAYQDCIFQNILVCGLSNLFPK